MKWLQGLAPAVVGARGPLGNETDLVRAYWRGQEAPALPAVPLLSGTGTILSSVCVGLGDTLMLTDMPKASKGAVKVFSTSQHFRPLMARNPWWEEPKPAQQLLLANAPTLVREYGTGNGHYVQRLRRAWGLPVEALPRASVAWKGRRMNNRVVMHFEPGRHVLWQRQNVHPKARALYPGTRKALEEFVAGARGMEFWCVGKAPEGGPLRGVQEIRTPSLNDLVERVGSCAWFIGIMSGVMHLASALKLKCVVLVNFPEAERVVLPTLRQTGQIESEWMYPQNVHLHQEGNAPLCPRATSDNLRRAFDGGVYPYWREDWCGLVKEAL